MRGYNPDSNFFSSNQNNETIIITKHNPLKESKDNFTDSSQIG